MQTESLVALAYHGSEGDFIGGTLVWGVNLSEAKQAQQQWDTYRQEIRNLGIDVDEKERDHIHWDWRRKAASLQHFHGEEPNWRLAGIHNGGQWEGLMLLRLNKRGRLETGSLVYVDYLMSAPWNRPYTTVPRLVGDTTPQPPSPGQMIPRPRLREVRPRLILAAIKESEEIGCSGRIALHALPDTDAFYSHRCRMTDSGPDRDYYNLHYFELSSEMRPQF